MNAFFGTVNHKTLAVCERLEGEDSREKKKAKPPQLSYGVEKQDNGEPTTGFSQDSETLRSGVQERAFWYSVEDRLEQKGKIKRRGQQFWREMNSRDIKGGDMTAVVTTGC